MEARVPNGSLLKRCFDAVREMVLDVNLDCNESGMFLQAMDASHVALVNLDLKLGAFDHYTCSRPRTLGLNMIQVAKIFRLCGNDDVVIIRHQDDADTVTFVFENDAEDRVSDFELRLMRFETEHLGVPEINFQAVATIPSKHFNKVIQDLGQFSDSISVVMAPKSIRFSSKGDFGSGNTMFQCGAAQGDMVEIKTTENTSLTFATRYLQYFTKATPLAERARLSLHPGQPLEMTYILRDDPTVGHIRYYLAPKMDADNTGSSENNAMDD